jgi:ethanolamine-phosphate phospho-lyase
MREERILLSLDGPYSNVMKIKPPLPFNKENSDLLIEKLDVILTLFGKQSKL